MSDFQDVRKQLRGYCTTSNLLTPSVSQKPIDTALTTTILKTFLTAFSTNTARLMPDGSYRTITGNQTVAIHPSSVLFGRKVEAIVYHQCVFTNRSYARGVSAVEMGWVADVLAAAPVPE
jgi:ATP-dependent RNA helicase DHR2